MNDRIVQFSQLGNFGRFGNQLFQYVFARAYAKKYDAILEIPKWIGERVFENVSHRSMSRRLPRISVDKIPWGKVNIDLYGYFQFRECFNLLSELELREWFVFQNKWLEIYSEKEDYVAAHVRRGDYSRNYSNTFCIVTKNSYLRACEKYDLDKQKLIWISEEKPTIDSRATDVSYKNVVNSMYGSGVYEDKGISFLPDFFKMINADVLLRSNSTFGFWAGFFRNGRRMYSPVVSNKTGVSDVEFVEGNRSAWAPPHHDLVFGK